jgi:beta-N-acetylhexosaminidase
VVGLVFPDRRRAPSFSVVLRLASIVLTVSLVAGCTTGALGPTASAGFTSGTPSTPVPTSNPTAAASASPSRSASPSISVGPSPVSTTACAAAVFARMTLAQRVGQLFIVGLSADRLDPATASAIVADHFGSVWLTTPTTAGVAGIRATADAVQALTASGTTAGVQFLVAANQEGGLIQPLRGPGFSAIPSAVAQGALAPATLQTDALTWGRQLTRAGVNLDFAPVADVVPAADVATNAPIGALQRDYGSDPTSVGVHVQAFIRGMRAAGVATVVKHFPGLGLVQANTDSSAGVIDDLTGPDDPDLAAFGAAIATGVPFVMVGLATYQRIDPDHLAAFSPIVLALLRQRLGFGGVIVSDSLGAAAALAAEPDAGSRAVDFILAGGDLIIPGTLAAAQSMAQALIARSARDLSFERLVDSAALRILRAKAAWGLLPCG